MPENIGGTVVLAPAKINLVLSVNGKRDDGYHNLSTVMQTISLYDSITVCPSCDITVVSDNAPCGRENICFAAAEIFKSFGGAEIKIEKNIPLSAGLGGGSSNAAAVLLALNKLYKEPFSETELIEKAISLGSDVPFFIKGGTCRVDGKGDKLNGLAFSEYHLVIIKDGQKQSTGAMYKSLDESGLCDRTAEVDAFCAALEDGDPKTVSRLLFNDFEKVNSCNAVKKDLMQHGALGACLSGSGPSVFGIFADGESAKRCADVLKQKYAFVFACKTVE